MSTEREIPICTFDNTSDVEILTDMLGVVFDAVIASNDELLFFNKTKQSVKFYHNQDCCESVSIDDIDGDLDDLINSPILVAESVSSGDWVDEDEHETWTFYRFATVKGFVTVRWCGGSNGYYSEEVDIMWNGFNTETDEQ